MLISLIKTFFMVYVAYNLVYYLALSTFLTFILLLIRKVTNGYISPFLDDKKECFWFGFAWPYYIVKLIIQAFVAVLKDNKKA